MQNEMVLEKMYSSAIIPVVAINNSDAAIELGRAFLAAGIKVVEITLRTEAGIETIRKLCESNMDIMVGAGTVLSVEMAEKAVENGAKFLISPGFDEEVVSWAVEHQVPVFPGVTSPSEIAKAQKFGLEVLKFFPSENIGGVRMLKSLKGPYPNLKFMPTGGIDESNIGAYMNLSNVLACGGSWLCPAELIRKHQFEEITRLSKAAVRQVHDISLMHMGINAKNAEDAEKIAHAYGELLGFPVYDGETFFAGDMIEICKTPGKGANGHMALGVRNINRAMAYFKSMGYKFDEMQMVKDEKGILAVYFEEEFGGFAVHLRRK